MKPHNILTSNDIDDPKYIIIKIPRDSLRDSDTDSLAAYFWETRIRKGIWVFLCIFLLLFGIVLGSIFHPFILHNTTDKAVWKSSSLISPDGK